MHAAPTVRLEGVYCTMEIARPALGLVVVTITGSDVGEFGEAPFRELAADVAAGEPIDLFVDARSTQGASIDVSADWALWLRKHRGNLSRVTMITGSRFIEISADFVRRFAGLEGVMRLTNNEAAFDAALAAARAERR